MYDRTFGTDWDSLEDRDEALWRAFGLGVAECLGEEYPGELERISNAVETNYDRSFAELAYQKGRQHVQQFDSGTDPDAIWRHLVEERSKLDLWADPTPKGDTDADAVDSDAETTGLPDSLRRFRVDSRPADSTDRVERPSLLDREQSGRPQQSTDGDRTLFGGRRDTTERGDDGERAESEVRDDDRTIESGRDENESENGTDADS